MYSCLDTNDGNKVYLMNDSIEQVEVIDDIITVVLTENLYTEDQWIFYLTLDGTLIGSENLNH